MVLVNDCRPDVSPVNISDSDFGKSNVHLILMMLTNSIEMNASCPLQNISLCSKDVI